MFWTVELNPSTNSVGVSGIAITRPHGGPGWIEDFNLYVDPMLTLKCEFCSEKAVIINHFATRILKSCNRKPWVFVCVSISTFEVAKNVKQIARPYNIYEDLTLPVSPSHHFSSAISCFKE